MPLEQIATFGVNRLSVLDQNGKADEKLMPKLNANQLKELYTMLVQLRIFDDKALKLQRQGRIGTYASSLGQEACTVGSGYALQPQDWTFPAFREHGMFFTRGVGMVKTLQYWGGDERGSHPGADYNCFPVSIPVGSQPLHAVGCAMAMQYKKADAVAVGYVGDGGTSEGEFQEAMNFAGVFNAPVILICQNNQYAISLERKKQTAAQTIAQKAIAYGIEGIQVDGNDVFATYLATKMARDKALAGKGPTFLEFYTYRMGDHTTADDSTRYRTKEEVEDWRKKDPIARVEKYLLEKGVLSPPVIEQIKQAAVEKVEKVVQEYETMPPQKPEDMFDFMYAEIPKDLAEQKREYLGFLSSHGEEKTKDTEGPGFP